jgi:hypothetical protein
MGKWSNTPCTGGWGCSHINVADVLLVGPHTATLENGFIDSVRHFLDVGQFVSTLVSAQPSLNGAPDVLPIDLYSGGMPAR